MKKVYAKTKKLKKNPNPTKLKKNGDYLTTKTPYNNSYQIMHYPKRKINKRVLR